MSVPSTWSLCFGRLQRVAETVRHWWVSIVLLEVLATVKLVDALSTSVLLATVPRATEANPLLVSLFAAVGRQDALLLTSAAAIVLHAVWAELAGRWLGSRGRQVALVGPAVAYAMVSAWNLFLIL